MSRGAPRIRAAELRILEAFAEAMAPGAGALPAASEVPIAKHFERYARCLDPRTLRRLRLALRIFDWLPFPWRFSRASLAARRRFLADLEGSGLRSHRDLLLLIKTFAGIGYAGDPRVQTAVGFEARCAIDHADPGSDPGNPGPAPLGELEPQEEGEECDVAIVGSGAGGAVAAALLAEAGLDVLVLEAGPYLDRRTYPEEPLEALAALYRDGGLTYAAGRPLVAVPVGRAVGGTTVVNSGTCLRAPEEVLRAWRDREGIGWATALEPEYAAAEELLRVTALDLAAIGRNGQLVAEGAGALGLRGAPLPRNAGRCVQCSSCPTGCRLDAKRAMHVSYLPRAVAAGARVRAGVEARRIIFERGRAAGVDCTVNIDGAASSATRPGAAGRPFVVRARRAVISAGGAFGTPELLIRSGIRHRMLGRNLRLHPAVWVGARFEQGVRGWEGVMQSYQVSEWEELGINMEATFTPLAFGAGALPGVGHAHQRRMLEYDRIASNGVHLSDRSTGRVWIDRRGNLRISYRLGRDDARRLAFGVARAAEIWFAAGATEVYPGIGGNPVIGPGDVAALEASPPPGADLRLEAFHPMGTARMAADPKAGVAAPDGSVRGANGLYVVDAGILPSSLGVNPMMTIIACASRIARDLAGRLG